MRRFIVNIDDMSGCGTDKLTVDCSLYDTETETFDNDFTLVLDTDYMGLDTSDDCEFEDELQHDIQKAYDEAGMDVKKITQLVERSWYGNGKYNGVAIKYGKKYD